jgi:hypothetical protein
MENTLTNFQKYYLKHKEDKIICTICNGKYSLFTKFNHFNTKKHKKCEILEKEKENKLDFMIIDQIEKGIKLYFENLIKTDNKNI